METTGNPPIATLGVSGIENAVEIGRGTASMVFRAQQPELNRAVAVKVLSVPDPTGDHERRFRLELLAMGRLSRHPNVVSVYAAGWADNGRPYMLMELAGGGSGADLLARGAVDWRLATRIGVRLGGAVEAAHRSRVLHGDIKPADVLFSDYGVAKLTGFGAPPFERRPGEAVATSRVTVEHAAPELLAGGPATVASDVYGLASTVFTLIAGAPPFARERGMSREALLHRASTEPPPDLRRRRGVPDAVCTVLEQALNPDPEARPGSALAFARALEAARRAEGEPAITPSASGEGGDVERAEDGDADLQPAPRRRRRRRRVVLAALAAALLVAGGVAAALVVTHSGPNVATHALTRYFDPAIPDRDESIDTRGPAGFATQQVLGYLPSAQVPGGTPVYACLYNRDHFLSSDPACEGYSVLGLIGWAWSTPPSGAASAPLYRCWTRDHLDHFVSNDPYCEGQMLYGFLGYVQQHP
jgi:Protein kinase domain